MENTLIPLKCLTCGKETVLNYPNNVLLNNIKLQTRCECGVIFTVEKLKEEAK